MLEDDAEAEVPDMRGYGEGQPGVFMIASRFGGQRATRGRTFFLTKDLRNWRKIAADLAAVRPPFVLDPYLADLAPGWEALQPASSGKRSRSSPGPWTSCRACWPGPGTTSSPRPGAALRPRRRRRARSSPQPRTGAGPRLRPPWPPSATPRKCQPRPAWLRPGRRGQHPPRRASVRSGICRPGTYRASCGRVDDVGRRVEIRLSNLEMNDVPALCFQRSRLQDFESGLRAKTRHALRETKFAGILHGTDYARTRSSLNHQNSTFRPSHPVRQIQPG